MAKSRIDVQWHPRAGWAHYRTGVSLHSHTAHSREILDFVPRLKARLRWLAWLIAPYEQRYLAQHGQPLDWSRLWWTPPLSARESLELERNAITGRLDRNPLVSLTDHDSMEAPLQLGVLREGRDVPISVEWSVPFGNTVFHLGVHNVPRRTARQQMEVMTAYTAKPEEQRLGDVLAWLCENPGTLIVFNHPFWDERGIGPGQHRAQVGAFLATYGPHLHALELNGLRPWAENREILAYARELGMPAVSGGDRHGCEPNVLLNLTNAESFAEFVDEVRYQATSHILLTSSYRESMLSRLSAAVADAVRDNEHHGYGWKHWSERVFHLEPGGASAALGNGQPQEEKIVPIASYFPEGLPKLAEQAVALAGLLDWRGVRQAVRFVSPPLEDLVL